MRETAFDPSFRPTTYWLFSDVSRRSLATVRGERERFALAALASDSYTEYMESLPPGEGPLVGASPAALMAGEYLPAKRRGEVEIARIGYESVLGDVVSIRARWYRGKIRYRIVDDFADDRETRFPYSFRPRSSAVPLTMGELIGIIDGVVDPWADGRVGLVLSVVDEFVRRDGMDPKDYVDFVRVTSVHYPQLGSWYRKRLKEWCAATEAELEREAQQ